MLIETMNPFDKSGAAYFLAEVTAAEKQAASMPFGLVNLRQVRLRVSISDRRDNGKNF